MVVKSKSIPIANQREEDDIFLSASNHFDVTGSSHYSSKDAQEPREPTG
jgi:hypothetical protein